MKSNILILILILGLLFLSSCVFQNDGIGDTAVSCPSGCFDSNGDGLCDVCEAIKPGNLQLHEHTYEWNVNEEGHLRVYTCCQDLGEYEREMHVDYDENLLCDECSYKMKSEPKPEPTPPAPEIVYLSSLEEWMSHTNVSDIVEIKTERSNGSIWLTRYYVDVRRTRTEKIIKEVYESYRTMELEPCSTSEIPEGAGVFSISFVLSDGNVHTLHFDGGLYRGGNAWENPYFRSYFVADLDIYDENVKKTISLALFEKSHSIHTKEGIYLGDIPEMGDLEFIEFVGTCSLNDHTHYIHTEYGKLYIIGAKIACLDYDDAGNYIYLELVNGDFYEMIENQAIK